MSELTLWRASIWTYAAGDRAEGGGHRHGPHSQPRLSRGELSDDCACESDAVMITHAHCDTLYMLCVPPFIIAVAYGAKRVDV